MKKIENEIKRNKMVKNYSNANNVNDWKEKCDLKKMDMKKYMIISIIMVPYNINLLINKYVNNIGVNQ